MQRRSFLKKAAVGGRRRGSRRGAGHRPVEARASSGVWRRAGRRAWTRIYGGAELVAKRVGEITDGKFQIRVFAAGEIVPALQVLDAVQAGTVEMGHTATYYYFGKDPAFALGTSMPSACNMRAELCVVVLRRRLAKRWRRCSRSTAASRSAPGSTGCQMGGWFRKEIKTVADLQGPEVPHRRHGRPGAGEAGGVVPQMIGGPDIYPALEKGTIDGAEWVGPYDDEKLGFNKVAKYYYYPGWWEGGPIADDADQREEVERAAQALPGRAARGVQRGLRVDAGEVRRRRIPMRCAGWSAAAPSCVRSRKPVMEACEKAAYELYERAAGQERALEADLSGSGRNSATTSSCGSGSPSRPTTTTSSTRKIGSGK